MSTTGISYHHETIDVLSAAGQRDRYGNAPLNWNQATTTTVDNCRLIPVPSAEIQERLTRRWVLYAPLDTALVTKNRVRWRGVVYEVTGDVRRWDSPSGRLAHLEADLERVEG
jgi:hypothetical protein